MESVPSKLEIGLRQRIENDSWLIAELLNSGYSSLIGECGHFTDIKVNVWLKQFAATRLVTVQKGLRTYTIGFAGLRKLHERAKHAELVVFAVGASAGNGATKSLEDPAVVSRCLAWAFGDLGLSRVWISVIDGNPLLDLLENSGWVAEGVKTNNSINHKGVRVDEVICSISQQSWESAK